MADKNSLPSLEKHLGYWLRHVSNHVSGSFARALNARQTSVAEWVALNYIDARPSTTVSELAELLGMTRGAASKVLDKLEKKTWVTRTTKPEDNRVQYLTLTLQGDQVLPELSHSADDNETFFHCLSSEERNTLRSLLQKVAHANQWTDVPTD